MIIFNSIYGFINNLSRKEFIRWTSVYLGTILFIVILILARHILVLRDLKNKMIQLNASRKTVQEILTKYQEVDQQKTKVDDALKKNNKFNIQKFFEDLGTKEAFIRQVKSVFSKEKLANGYTEEKLVLSFLQIDTKQLCEFLQEIQNEPLVYVTFVDINKTVAVKKINVSMAIATLRVE